LDVLGLVTAGGLGAPVGMRAADGDDVLVDVVAVAVVQMPVVQVVDVIVVAIAVCPQSGPCVCSWYW
jgi:hypothetical protein